MGSQGVLPMGSQGEPFGPRGPWSPFALGAHSPLEPVGLGAPALWAQGPLGPLLGDVFTGSKRPHKRQPNFGFIFF